MRRAPGWRCGPSCSVSGVTCRGLPMASSPSSPCSSGPASGASRSSTGPCSTTPSGQGWTRRCANQTTRASCRSSQVSYSVVRSIFFYTDSSVLGGAEKAMFMLLESLDRGEWRPTLLLDDQPGAELLAERAAALGVPVRLVGPLPLGLGGARAVPALARLLRRERPAVFHAHMSSPVACKWGLAAAVAARVPAVLGTVQVGGYVPPDHSAYWQLRALARRVDRYLAVSDDIARELVEDLGWPRGKIDVVYNAV